MREEPYRCIYLCSLIVKQNQIGLRTIYSANVISKNFESSIYAGLETDHKLLQMGNS